MEKEAVILYTAVNGFLIDVPVEKVRSFIAGLLDYLSNNHPGILKTIAETGAVQPEQEKELSAAVEAYKQSAGEKPER